jgi:hypothetical protein
MPAKNVPNEKCSYSEKLIGKEYYDEECADDECSDEELS